MSSIVKKDFFEISASTQKGKFNSKLEYEFFSNFESPHTRKNYRNDISQFFEFLRDHFSDVKQYGDIERVHFVAFRNWLADNEMAPKTINRKLASNSSFMDFLVEKNLIAFNPCSSIKRPRQEVKTPTRDLTDDQVAHLFDQLSKLEGPGLLHKAILYTLFTTGIRKAELINLKIEDIREENGDMVLEIRAKGGKQLSKLVHPVCAQVINDYLSWLKTEGEELHPKDWVFRPTRNPLDPTHMIKPLNPKSVDYIVKTWCRKAGIFDRISPHSARATYIGSALENGIDLYKVSRDVGHASVKTTEEYNKRRQRLSDSPVHGLGFLKKDS